MNKTFQIREDIFIIWLSLLIVALMILIINLDEIFNFPRLK